MSTINIYDSSTGKSYPVTIDLRDNVVAGSQDGSIRFYIVISTTAKNPEGTAVAPRVVRDVNFDDEITPVIQANLIEIFKAILGTELISSSSSESSLSITYTMGLSSQSSISSSRLEGTSSSSTSSTTSANSFSSASSVSSVSSASSASSASSMSSASSPSSVSTPSSTYSAHP